MALQPRKREGKYYGGLVGGVLVDVDDDDEDEEGVDSDEDETYEEKRRYSVKYGSYRPTYPTSPISNSNALRPPQSLLPNSYSSNAFTNNLQPQHNEPLKFQRQNSFVSPYSSQTSFMYPPNNNNNQSPMMLNTNLQRTSPQSIPYQGRNVSNNTSRIETVPSDALTIDVSPEAEYEIESVFICFRKLENIRRSCNLAGLMNVLSSNIVNRYMHCEMVFRMRSTRNKNDLTNCWTCTVYEETGVTFHHQKDYLNKCSNWAPFRLLGVTQQGLQWAYDFCNDQKGKEYDSVKFFRNYGPGCSFTYKPTDQKSWVCSELVAYALKHYLLPKDFKDTEPALMTPDMIQEVITSNKLYIADTLARSKPRNHEDIV